MAAHCDRFGPSPLEMECNMGRKAATRSTVIERPQLRHNGVNSRARGRERDHSLATSTFEDLPRHIDSNGLNVAISRARTLSIVLAIPNCSSSIPGR